MGLKNSAIVRTFTSAKLVNNRFLNRCGLQVARTYGARCIYNMRPSKVDRDISSAMQTLRRDGMVVMENFLPSDEFESLKAACHRLLQSDPERLTHKQHGPTNYTMAALKNYDQAEIEEINPFFRDPRLVGLMQGAEKRKLQLDQAHRAVEWVRQGESTTQGDPETALHSDIFFHTHKAWLYLSDVTPESAPLVFVKGSHRLSATQAKSIYRHSVDPKTPSRRIDQAELEKLGLKEEAMQCAANTLVVANVCGYHRRSIGQPGGERFALHCSVRSQPFALWKNRQNQ